METQNTDKHLFWHAFGELPVWQRVAIVVCGVIGSPFLGLLAAVTAVSLFPFFLLGRWEGSLGKAPLEHEVARAIHHRRQGTRQYYGTAEKAF